MNHPRQRGGKSNRGRPGGWQNTQWVPCNKKVDTSSTSKDNSSSTDGSPLYVETRPEDAGRKVSEDSAGIEQLSNSERHQHTRDFNANSVPEVHHDDGHGHDRFSMVDPSATKGKGSCSNSWDSLKDSAGNERPSSAKRHQSPKAPSSLLSDGSSLPIDVSSFSVHVSEADNLYNTGNHQNGPDGNHQNGPEKPENKIPGVRLDICKVKSAGAVTLKPSVYAKNREIRKASLQKSSEILRPGMVLLKNHINHAEQMKIIKVCRDLGLGAGGFYKPCFGNGGKMNLQMMCLGMDWDPERKVYDYRRSVDDAIPPSVPDEFKQIVKRAVTESHALIKEKHKKCNPADVIPSMQPDICIINFYSKTGTLGLHQDKDETEESLDKGLPVVSISIGDSAEFLYGEHGDVEGANKVILESGDVLIFGGKSRHIFHGVKSILPDTAPKALVAEANLRPGRLNLTFRKY
ncbi:hypothetical protein C5167_045288 [Papaver somniferum]|uniref:Fe2OG dioxygenase domain-containing protein n=1 Tax=Papaver somniferum TaxID=3469 RepID=A0A4Y7LAJ3_PAPSO|nr:uncharacterized protein LOC113320857 [Papaver somniferum]RZC82503.1 hypothetical protein C5167_045288 [Papaver somniferum]